jgi:hypothetical protein
MQTGIRHSRGPANTFGPARSWPFSPSGNIGWGRTSGTGSPVTMVPDGVTAWSGTWWETTFQRVRTVAMETKGSSGSRKEGGDAQTRSSR